jgi:hypothetical protein
MSIAVSSITDFTAAPLTQAKLTDGKHRSSRFRVIHTSHTDE